MEPQRIPLAIDREEYGLRPLREDDPQLDLVPPWLVDPTSAQMLNIPPAEWTLDRVREFVRRHDPFLAPVVGVFAKHDRAPPGGQLIGVYRIQVDWNHRSAALSVLIGNRAWRAKKVLGRMSLDLERFLFETWGIRKLSAQVRPDNLGVRVILRMAGYKKEAHLRGQIPLADGSGRGDIEVYGLTASDRDARNRLTAAGERIRVQKLEV